MVLARAWGLPLYQLGIWLESNIRFLFSISFACRIARGQEETSTSGRPVGRLRGDAFYKQHHLVSDDGGANGLLLGAR